RSDRRNTIVLEGRITQAIAKGEQRLAVAIDIFQHFGGLVIIENGQLSYCLRKCHRDSSSRVVVAEERLRNSPSSKLTWIPSFQNRWNVLRGPGDRQRPAILQNQDDRFPGCRDRFEQLLLIAREI